MMDLFKFSYEFAKKSLKLNLDNLKSRYRICLTLIELYKTNEALEYAY